MLNKVRIIAGQWRGRNIEFPHAAGLRPTPNRIRETLFNWLAPYIHDAYFLDAFGGSGALSFEALSRGAGQGIYIDAQATARHQCQLNAQKLNTTCLTIVSGTAPDCFAQLSIKRPFDLVFLDPPFQHNLLEASLQALLDYQLIHSQSLIYFEAEKTWSLSTPISRNFNLIKNQHAGMVTYGLLSMKN